MVRTLLARSSRRTKVTNSRAGIGQIAQSNGQSVGPRFRVRNLNVRYGSTTAVQDLNLDVESGQIVGLIGPNGAGKTSVIDAVTGFAKATGSVVLDGVEIGHLPAHERAILGVARAWQSLELFDDLTVEENLRVPATSRGLTGGHRDTAHEALRRVGLAVKLDQLPSDLSMGQLRLLVLAQALAAKPMVLLADEPAAGLDSRESQDLGDRLRAIAESGVAVLLVDHDMDLVLRVCDHIYVMDFGRVIADGAPSDIRQNAAVVKAYLGGNIVGKGIGA